MLLFCKMSKIFKHTFEIEQLALIDGELAYIDPKKVTCAFTLTHGGIGRFEEEYHESLLAHLSKINVNNLNQEKALEIIGDKKFLRTLAAASYVKTDDGKFEYSNATMQEFLESEVIDLVTDIDFVIKLLEMTTECLVGKNSFNGAVNKSTKQSAKNK